MFGRIKMKTMINLVRTLVLLLVTTTIYAQNEGNAVEIQINNIDNEEGQMMIGLYDTQGNWLNKPFKGVIGKIVNGKCSTTINNIPTGTYAISVFHDENNDSELETNFLGIPTEDIGSSNDAPARFGPPKWEDAKFEVKEGTVTQVINL